MNQVGERQTNTVIPSFNRTIRIDFRGAKISSDTGVLMLREIDERFNITAPLIGCLDDPRRASHSQHTYVDLIRQRVYQMAAGYEDCNDANYLHMDPALRLALGKDEEYAASQSMLSASVTSSCRTTTRPESPSAAARPCSSFREPRITVFPLSAS